MPHDTRPPGTPPARPPRAAPKEGPTAPRRDAPDLRTAILRALLSGPASRDELRYTLGEPDMDVMRALRYLRDDGKVYIVSLPNQVHRKWALANWRKRAPAREAWDQRPMVLHRVRPPATSWWATTGDFTAAARARWIEAGWQTRKEER